MARDHFSKIMRSPQFQQERYKNTPGGKLEIKIENFFFKIIKKIKIWKKKK